MNTKDWKYVDALEYCHKITDGTHDSPKSVEKGKPLITSRHIKGRNIDFENAYLISEKEYEKINLRSKVDQWDVIISMIGEYCGFCYVERSQEINYAVKNLGLFKTGSKINADWLYYYLSSNQGKQSLSRIKSGSSQPYLTLGGLRELKILVPTIEIVQEKIVDTLAPLDSKIELNNRINAELEAMAKTLYNYWFVQFDFPDKNGKPYKTSCGEMVWNEELKREIPKGWEVQKMSEWLDIDKSGDWGKDEAEGNFTKKVICFRGADINGLNGLDELKPPVRYILEKNSFKILKSHDLVIEISGGSPTQSTGRLAFITDATIKRFEHPLICSNFCKPVSMRNKKLLYNFVYYWNSLYDNGVFFGYEGKTSGIKNLLLDSFLSSYYTVVPDKEIVNQFYDIMDNIQEKKQTVLSENQKLSELRDWLLPMLMNGQVKVK